MNPGIYKNKEGKRCSFRDLSFDEKVAVVEAEKEKKLGNEFLPLDGKKSNRYKVQKRKRQIEGLRKYLLRERCGIVKEAK